MATVERWQRRVELAKAVKKPLFLIVPGIISIFWLLWLSESVEIGNLAIKTGFFIFIVVLIFTAFVHTVTLVYLEGKLRQSEKRSKLPSAQIHKE